LDCTDALDGGGVEAALLTMSGCIEFRASAGDGKHDCVEVGVGRSEMGAQFPQLVIWRFAATAVLLQRDLNEGDARSGEGHM